MVQRVLAVRRSARRGFTLIELIVAMALIAILAGVGLAVYSGQIAQAHTHALIQTMDQMNTAMGVFQGYDSSSGYPEKGNPAADNSLTDGAANSGAAAYRQLTTDLATVGVNGLPAGSSGALPSGISSFTYEPNDTTTPPAYTIVATAANGTTDVLCADPVNGVVDLGAGGTPQSAGVACK